MKSIGFFLLPTLCLFVNSVQTTIAGPRTPTAKEYPNASGASRSYSLNRVLDKRNAFFQNLGSNGRACITCHQPDQGWSVTPENIQRTFEETRGLDPIFRINDGSVSPIADVSTVKARRHAYSMLLSKGLIRVGLPIPANAEFELANVDDPYCFASKSELSLFRRPLPSTNLRFLSAVMWDGRETAPNATIHGDLITQALDATLGHAQLAGQLTDDQLTEIVDFESGLATAQSFDHKAGDLDDDGAKGGPYQLFVQDFFIGINDPLGGNPTGVPFNPKSMTLFEPWGHLRGKSDRNSNRAAVARGQEIFNSKPINITGVGGLNDNLNQPVIKASCTICHDSPNVGNHSVIAPLNIGLTDASRRTPDMPLYSLRNKTTGETVQTTDPGRALVSGKWKDIGKFKGPVLRSLSARPPYFHNGSAESLDDVVDFYNTRFNIGLTPQEKSDLVAFLCSL